MSSPPLPLPSAGMKSHALLATLIRDPALHLLFKVTVPLLLLFLCVFIYFSEKSYGKDYSSRTRNMLEMVKISIFLFS
jgi:hypothetical protein